jgi:hypothetical protein
MLYKINDPRVVYQAIDGESLIIDFETGIYYSLDQVGADIWEMLSKTARLDEIVEAIIQRYTGDPAEIENSIGSFLAEIQRESLIVPLDEGESTEDSPLESAVADKQFREPLAFKAPVLNRYTDMQDLLLLDAVLDVDARGWPSQATNTPGG